MQVLEQFSTEQFQRRLPHAVQMIQDISGQNTYQAKRQATNELRGKALRKLIESGVPNTLVQQMSTMITPGNIEWTAKSILKTPELLSLPTSILNFLQKSSRLEHRGLARSNNIRCTCFVRSPRVGVHFANVWDVERQHADHVRHCGVVAWVPNCLIAYPHAKLCTWCRVCKMPTICMLSKNDSQYMTPVHRCGRLSPVHVGDYHHHFKLEVTITLTFG